MNTNARKSEIIKKVFQSLAGKKIKTGSLVVKYGDKNIYQVTTKDSKIAYCKVANTFFTKEEKDTQNTNKKTEVFYKKDLCVYFLLLSEIEKALQDDL